VSGGLRPEIVVSPLPQTPAASQQADAIGWFVMATLDVAHGPPGVMVETAPADELVTITVRGDLDDAAISEVARAIVDSVSRARADVVLDLGDLASIDAAGLEFLVRVRRRVARGGGTLTVSRPTPEVHRLLAICGIVDLDLSSPRPSSSHAPGRQALALAADAESRMYGT
jgi:anti-anti-sigma factor